MLLSAALAAQALDEVANNFEVSRLTNHTSLTGVEAVPPTTSLRNPARQSRGASAKSLVKLYAHVFGGVGTSVLSSSDVKEVVSDDFGIGIGLPTWAYGIRAGFSNIVQFEYNKGIADHNFNNNSIIPDIPSEVINMDYRTTDLQLKINPLFFTKKRNNRGMARAIFVVIGTGDVEWRDEENDGFEGTSSIFGLEYSVINKSSSISFSFKRYGIEFDETIIFGIPFEVKTTASDWIFEMKIGFGLGI